MANINKNQIGYEEVLTAGTANALMVQYKRANAAPLDISEVFTSISAATEYAKSGPISYAGQVIAVAGEGIKTEVFTITSASTIVRLVDENDLLSVEQSAGKIDEIKLNGSTLTIEGKSVNIDLSEYTKNSELYAIISGDTGKTIREIASEEIASKLISEGAQESLDTLEEIAAWIQSHPDDVASMNETIVKLEKSAHTHENKEVLDGITADKVTAWDSAEAAANAYTDSKVDGKFDEAGAAAQALEDAKADAASLYQPIGNYEAAGAAASAESAAKAYADTKAEGTLSSAKAYADGLAKNYEVAGAAASALTEAKAYTDGLASNYDEAGAAASAESAAKAYVDSKVDGKFDEAGAAASAESAAKAYADGLAKNYEVAGAAASALTEAKAYASNLSSNYDSAGSANAALSSAKAYADGLAKNYDVAGAAASAESAAKAYTDTKLVDYATKSYVTDTVIGQLSGGTVVIEGYAKVEDAKTWDSETLSSAITYIDSAITISEEKMMWLPVEDSDEKHIVRHWRGTREKYEFLKRNGALSVWTKYVVIDTIANKEVLVEYYGENQVTEFTGQLLPVNSIIETIAEVTAAPYDRYLVGMNGIGYNIYECVLDDEGALKWYVKPFDYRYGVRVKSKGLKNYVIVNGILTTYDDVDCGEF